MWKRNLDGRISFRIRLLKFRSEQKCFYMDRPSAHVDSICIQGRRLIHTEEKARMDVFDPDIETIVNQIVERFSPQKILLFGSWAYGEPTFESDVDLLVVMETEESSLHTAARISETIGHPVPLDIIVRSPEEFASQLAERSQFECRIHRDGISLYEAADRGMDSESRRGSEHRSA